MQNEFYWLRIEHVLLLWLFLLFLCTAIEIVGHASPIIVGLRRIINCSTILSANKIEWVLVGLGSGDPLEERSDGGRFLELSLTPEATEMNGAKFICRVTTLNNRVLEETITLEIKGNIMSGKKKSLCYTKIIC